MRRLGGRQPGEARSWLPRKARRPDSEATTEIVE